MLSRAPDKVVSPSYEPRKSARDPCPPGHLPFVPLYHIPAGNAATKTQILAAVGWVFPAFPF